MNATHTITITRWMMLRVWPSAWREGLRSVEVDGQDLSPWHPLAWAFFVVGVWAILTARGDR